jgi:hypothetical protein
VATVQVLLRTGVGELIVERRGVGDRICIRTHVGVVGRPSFDSGVTRPGVEPAPSAAGNPPSAPPVASSGVVSALPLLSRGSPPRPVSSTTKNDGTVNRSWQTYVANLCSDAWGLSALRSKKVVEEIEVLIATDQLSDASVAGVLARVGVVDTVVGAAARSIRITIGDGATAGVYASRRGDQPI